jgi:predicted dehydrogenase
LIRLGLVGLGKMGISHLSIAGAHPKIEIAGVCDANIILLDTLKKQTGVPTYSSLAKMIEDAKLDAVLIATPSKLHGPMVRAALEANLHVFCEKPFCLDLAEGEALAALAEQRGLVNQVGYHYRFVAAFEEARRLLAAGAIGKVHSFRVEAYGPVVLRPKGSTWRSSKSEGGGCLYDYASHAIDLVNYTIGTPGRVGGTVLNRIFSRDVDDEVYATFYLEDGVTGQLAANWSDESYRKMSTKLTVWGTGGRINADRQEVQIYLRDQPSEPGLVQGWNTRYTTDLTQPVDFYLRGEEYSAQLAHFVDCIEQQAAARCTFAEAAKTDRIAAMMLADSEAQAAAPDAPAPVAGAARPRNGLFDRFRQLARGA